MAANEISEKLARELIERINHLERFCDNEYIKSGCSDSDWLSVAVMAFDIKVHLIHHRNQNIDNKEKKM